MCGRYTFVAGPGFFKKYGLTPKTGMDLPTSYNIAPGSEMPVVLAGSEYALMKWGLIPVWAKDPKIGMRMINARAETLLQKPSFKRPFLTKRCIIPATGFYEWTDKNGKEPYYFYHPEDKYLSLAGIYDEWQNNKNEVVTTYTIITTEPNPVVAPIHNRMPLVLGHREEADWLNPGASLPSLELMLAPSVVPLTKRHVSKKVNSTMSEGPELIV